MKFQFLRTALIVASTLATLAPAFAVEVADLYDELNSNAMAFRQKYVGKPLTVTGKVWIINGEVTPATVSLTGSGDRYSMGTLLICAVGSKSSLLPLAKGQPVTVSGTLQSVGSAGIYMQPCGAR